MIERESPGEKKMRNIAYTVYIRGSTSLIFPRRNAGLHLANFQRLSRPKTVRTSAPDKLREIVDARFR